MTAPPMRGFSLPHVIGGEGALRVRVSRHADDVAGASIGDGEALTDFPRLDDIFVDALMQALTRDTSTPGDDIFGLRQAPATMMPRWERYAAQLERGCRRRYLRAIAAVAVSGSFRQTSLRMITGTRRLLVSWLPHIAR